MATEEKASNSLRININEPSLKKDFDNSFSKYPKELAKVEQKNTLFLSDEDKKNIIEHDKINKISSALFSYHGAYGYMIDFINYIINIVPEKVSLFADKNYYEISIDKDAFFYATIGKYPKQKDVFITEFYSMVKSTPKKWLPTKEGTNDYIELIRIILSDSRPLKTKEYNLKTLDGNVGIADTIKIRFYSYLWEGVTNNIKGSYFCYPSFLQAKIKKSLDKIIHNKVYQSLENNYFSVGDLDNAYSYRQLFLYLNMHDNGLHKVKVLKDIDINIINKECINNITKAKGKYYYRDKQLVYSFILKGAFLFNLMCLNEDMNGARFIPLNIKINSDSTISIDIIRYDKETQNRIKKGILYSEYDCFKITDKSKVFALKKTRELKSTQNTPLLDLIDT